MLCHRKEAGREVEEPAVLCTVIPGSGPNGAAADLLIFMVGAAQKLTERSVDVLNGHCG